eukprot:XP_011673807.1 PREDICTED: vacuolar protein sorting-associated protein 13D-like [Strongylocentrotus purpuratus]
MSINTNVSKHRVYLTLQRAFVLRPGSESADSEQICGGLDALMSEKCRTTENQIKNHDYMVEPVSAEARLKRNGSALPLRSRTTPRYVCDLTLQKIPLSLSEDQYRGITVLMKEFERNGKARHYRKWRPEAWTGDKKGIRKWWQFAINSVLHGIKDRRRRRTPKFISERIGLNKQYTTVYTRFLEAKDIDPASLMV